MKRRWKDRVTILLPAATVYDAWGHLTPMTWQPQEEIWADVRPILGGVVTAVVTVRAPFEYRKNIQVLWQNTHWKIIQDPLNFPHSGVVQFKIEQI